jgi:ubiquinone/menaquinone biosynthesis C-methylase UbiE
MKAESKASKTINTPFSLDDRASEETTIPDYLQDVYRWAYLDARNAKFLDQEWVVNIILWNNAKRLREAVLSEIKSGDKVLQVAHVYGKLIPELAARIGKNGTLKIIDISPLQVSLCANKMALYNNVDIDIANAASCCAERYDLVSCFFLLHEVPDPLKTDIIEASLNQVGPKGKAIFIDYHKPHNMHPLRLPMRLIFKYLEPFAESLWQLEVEQLAIQRVEFTWQKRTLFGGLYQVVIAQRL